MSGIVGANFAEESGLKRSHKFQRFTADGTWVKPSGITTVYMEVIGAGGGGARGTGGGGATRSGSGGGGGGALVSGVYNASNLASSLVVTIGAGGTGAVENTMGTDGGDSDISGTGFALKGFGVD